MEFLNEMTTGTIFLTIFLWYITIGFCTTGLVAKWMAFILQETYRVKDFIIFTVMGMVLWPIIYLIVFGTTIWQGILYIGTQIGHFYEKNQEFFDREI